MHVSGISLCFSAGLLLSYDLPVQTDRNGQPINRFLLSQSRSYQQMLSTLIHEVIICAPFLHFPLCNSLHSLYCTSQQNLSYYPAPYFCLLNLPDELLFSEFLSTFLYNNCFILWEYTLVYIHSVLQTFFCLSS